MSLKPMLSGFAHFRFYLIHLGYLLTVFFTARLMFMAWHWEKSAGLTLQEWAGTFTYGFLMDLSAAGYLIFPVLLLGLYREWAPFRTFRYWLHVHYFIAQTVIWTCVAADFEVYQAWGVKLNAEVVYYCRYPAEAWASALASPVFTLLAIGIATGVFFWRLSFRPFFQPERVTGWGKLPVWLRPPVYLLLFGLCFLMIRGGWGLTPMNPGFVYFSETPFANHAALNTTWNVAYDLSSRNESSKKEIGWFPRAEARATADSLIRRAQPDSLPSLFTVSRPNVVLIILESWTADMIPALGGIQGYTPGIDSLINAGLLFDRFYANGKRSAYGISCLLTGFPSIPDGAIIKFPTKFEKVPTVSERLGDAGYTSWFFYGGDSRFDNMNAFLLKSGFTRIVDKDQFRKEDQNSKWGAFDHVVLNRMADELTTIPRPFFSVLFTLSSHEPFETPIKPPFPETTTADRFKNSVWYSDNSIRQFFSRIRQEAWYDSTVIILAADHGHRFPLNRTEQHIPERFHIPLILTGPALRAEWKGKRIQEICSQADLAATLLNQLRLRSDDFVWSNDLMNPSRNNFAFYNINDGFGWIRPDYQVSYDFISEKIIQESNPDYPEKAARLREGKAYLQALYRYFDRIEWNQRESSDPAGK